MASGGDAPGDSAPREPASTDHDPDQDPPARSRGSRAKLRTAAALAGGAAVLALLLVLLVRSGRRRAAETAAAVVESATLDMDAAVAETAETDAAAAPEAPIAKPPPPPVWRVANLAGDSSYALVEGTVGKRTLVAALLGAGINKAESYRVIHAFDGVKSFDRTNPRDTFSFAKDKHSGKVYAFEYATSPLDVWQAKDKDGELDARQLELRVEQRRVAVGVAVGDDLRASIVQAGLDDDMLKMLDDALEGHAELSDVRPGARLRIVATEDRVETAFARYAELDAVEYTPANPSARPLRVYYFSKVAPAQPHARPGGYYDAKGQQPYHGGWRSPVPLARIASRFNMHRMHPVLHVVMPHNGVDFAAPSGTPVYASAAGTVKSAGDGGACGNMVQIQHANGLVSAYCHLSRFAAGLHGGQHVEARQLIGYVGQTGRATGPHLHFAIKRGESYIDPLALKLDGVRVLPPGSRDEFAKVRADMDVALEAIALPPPVAGTPPADAGADDKTDETVFDDSPGLE